MVRGSTAERGYSSRVKENSTWFMHDFDGLELPFRHFVGTKDPYKKTRMIPPNGDETDATLSA